MVRLRETQLRYKLKSIQYHKILCRPKGLYFEMRMQLRGGKFQAL